MKGNGPEVLVVDDDVSFLDAAVLLIELLGFSTITARETEEALEILRSRPSIGTLLTNIVLPGAGGLDLAQLAKTANPGISIIYTTRYSPMLLLDSEAPQNGLLLRKTRDIEELKIRLSNVLERAQ